MSKREEVVIIRRGGNLVKNGGEDRKETNMYMAGKGRDERSYKEKKRR